MVSNVPHRFSDAGDSDGNYLASIVQNIRPATLGHDAFVPNVRTPDQNPQPVNGALDSYLPFPPKIG